MDDPTAVFTTHRPRLFAIAYRMLGSRADAEDVLQDAWLRWARTERSALQSEEAWLVTVVTRLALDRLRAAKTEREAYVGFWLPEPLVTPTRETPEGAADLASDVSMAFMWVLERLGPDERAAFLLRQAFDHDYADIAALLGKSEAACRQLVHRAAERMQAGQRRFEVSAAAHRRVLERFVQAARSGQREAIQAMLSEHVELVSDGGGKVPSIMKVLHGAFRVANLYWATHRRLPRIDYRSADVNGEPGLLRYIDGRLESAQAFVTDGERIVAVYVVRNPDKLAGIDAAAVVTSAARRPS
jgi:RNA polymerase sigma-70 factor (ECF subfamily)